jgi:hypothetical protein
MRQTIKRILREETRPYKIMRRTHLIDREIARLLDIVYYDKRICGRYDNANMFLQVVTETVVENLYFNTFYMMDDTSLEWESSVNFIYDFIKDSYGEKLKDYFNNMCNERIDIDESKSPKRDRDIVCSECGWSWKLSEGGHDPYTCHKCWNVNSKSELTEKCWPGYTQKGMKTMFGKRYPNCVKKTKK